MATNLVHFDTERSHNTIPAPLTWFPAGYPAAIAGVSLAGVNYETVSLLISITSFVCVTWLLWWLMRIMDPSPWAARTAILCWLLNSQAISYSVSALSEGLFTMCGLASLLFLIYADEIGNNPHVWICWMGSGVMAGLSYWVRYAGIVWVLAFLLFLMVQIVSGNKSKQSRRSAVAAGALLLLLVIPLMIRNEILVGDWKGGNNTSVELPIKTFVLMSAQVPFHLILGDGTLKQLKFPTILMSLGLIGLCIVACRSRASHSVWRLLAGKKGLVLSAFLIYSIGIGAIVLRSPVSYSPRMFVPVLPHLIGLTTCFVAFGMRYLAARNYGQSLRLAYHYAFCSAM